MLWYINEQFSKEKTKKIEGETSARWFDSTELSLWPVNDTEKYSKIIQYRSTFRLAYFCSVQKQFLVNVQQQNILFVATCLIFVYIASQSI